MKGKVKAMTKLISVCAAASVASSAFPVSAEEGETVLWRCTTEQSPWVEMEPLMTTAWDNDVELYIDVDQTTRYQTLTATPWGGCFNDRGWAAMGKLTDEERAEIIEALFGDDGLRLSAGRLPLGNSDYSMNRTQSYDELPEGMESDYAMERFSIDSDRAYLIPYIRAAMEVRPELKLWASPWSPPSWMKKNKTTYKHVTPEDQQSGNGQPNEIIWTPEVLTAYADYFVKFIEAYRDEENIKISMVMPQNEPTIDVGYASCVWTGEQLNEFIRDYLYPAIEKAGLDTEIYLGTFTDSQANRTDPTLDDPVTSKMIKGLGMQWWSAPLTKRIYRANRENGYVLMQSETKCGNGGNTWGYAEEHYDCVKEFFDAGVNQYMLWNMALDENGVNTNPYVWSQNAPIIVNSQTNEVTYTPMYYVTKHFSSYVDAGARRIKTDGNYGDKIAFQNADGENVLIVKNSSNMNLAVAINFNGRKIKPVVPPHSVNTFTIEGSAEGFDTDTDATYTDGGGDEEIPTMVKLFNYNSPTRSLSVSQASFNDGAELLAWDDRGAVEQQWVLRLVEDGWFRVESFNSEKVMGVWSGSTEAGARVVQWQNNGSNDQQWRFIPVLKDGNTYYKIQNRKSGLFLTYGEGEVINGSLAVQGEDSESAALLWEARVSQGDGLAAAKPLWVSDAAVTAGGLSCKISCGETGGYRVFCASYAEDGSLLSVSSRDMELRAGEETDFSAETAAGAARTSVYGWYKGGVRPAAERTDV